MTKTFDCPSCGAPLRPMGTPTQFCTYCESTIVVPNEQLPGRRVWPIRPAVNFPRVAVSPADIQQRNKRTTILICVFLLVVVIVMVTPFIFMILAAIIGALAGAN